LAFQVLAFSQIPGKPQKSLRNQDHLWLMFDTLGREVSIFLLQLSKSMNQAWKYSHYFGPDCMHICLCLSTSAWRPFSKVS